MTLTTRPLSDARTLAYREAGQGDPVLLIHGVGMQSAAWGPQIETLSKTHRVIAVDLPGHGGSDPLHDGAQLPDFVDWFQSVVLSLDLQKPSIVGHSMGALIAAGYAATYPSNAAHVVLLNGVFRRSDAARRAVIDRAEALSNGAMDIETPLARWFTEAPQDAKPRAQTASWLSAMTLTHYATAYTAFAHGDATYADQFAQITAPLLALTGGDDANSTPEMSHAMAQAAPNGRAIVIEGHRHMVNLTAPDAVSQHILTHLTTHPQTSQNQT